MTLKQALQEAYASGDEEGVVITTLEVDHASLDLMKGVVGYNEAIKITFRQYRVLPGQLAALTGPDDDTLTGLEMTAFDISAERAEGTIAWPDGRQQNVPTGPNAFFDRDSYPALFT
jgi:hypothetical protein